MDELPLSFRQYYQNEYVQSPISGYLIFVKHLQHRETVSLLKELSKVLWCFTPLFYIGRQQCSLEVLRVD